METLLALTIAGSDPSGGAGLQADLKVFKLLGVHGLSVAAALTAQNTRSVTGVVPVESFFLRQQLETLLSDMRPKALKTGMLLSTENIKTVAENIKLNSLQNLVVDPVSISSSGTALIEDGGMDLLKDLLFPLAAVITPNIYEASVLSGLPVESLEQMEQAAEILLKLGPKAVIVTGGHLEDEAVDIFHDGKVTIKLEGRKLPGSFHGTGCVFSSAITAYLARGESMEQSALKAKKFVEDAIAAAFSPGNGMAVLV